MAGEGGQVKDDRGRGGGQKENGPRNGRSKRNISSERAKADMTDPEITKTTGQGVEVGRKYRGVVRVFSHRLSSNPATLCNLGHHS